MDETRLEQVIAELEALPQVDFAQVLRRVFAARCDDLEQTLFRSSYALAIVSSHPSPPEQSVEWGVEIVASPTQPAAEGALLSEQGLSVRHLRVRGRGRGQAGTMRDLRDSPRSDLVAGQEPSPTTPGT
jgi:hypothetical protein